VFSTCGLGLANPNVWGIEAQSKEEESVAERVLRGRSEQGAAGKSVDAGDGIARKDDPVNRVMRFSAFEL
jgi:hypothetical protein